jgi:hypothetical protein
MSHPSWLQQSTIWERPEPTSCDASVKNSVFLSNKKISSAQLRKPRHTSRRDEQGGGARMYHSYSHSRTKWVLPHLICWSIFFPIFHMKLNLAPTSYFCRAKNLSCMLHGLTHMNFKIYRNFWNLIWANMYVPNISTWSSGDGRVDRHA